jgi:poly(ribitol-phosphate) beta-N-acetylglucosaminyltransferase
VPVDVSVIIPVYNPGEFIEPCIESLLAQSLPPDRYEVIFVNDGSTDDTPARLDKLAVEAEQVKVFHIPNSGWPGKPRNVGIDNARGEYVYFCDHDDQLTPEALERLVAFARKNDSDIVLGKLVGVGRGAPRQVFKQNVDDAKIIENSLTSNLTPQKLYRKAFLDEHQIRFPEGKRRLEDHVFVTKSYFLAKKISILADYPVYRHIRRDDGGNAAHQRVDPSYYLSFVRETIQIIEEHTEPGSEQRLQMLSRPFRHEMLGKLRKKGIVEGDRERQEKWVLGVRQLMLDHFPAGYEDQFPLVTRARAAAVLTGDVDLALSVGKAERSMRAHAKLTGARWDGQAWVLDVEAQLRFKDGTPLRIERDSDGNWWPEERFVRRDLLKRPLSKSELRHGGVAVVIAHRGDSDEWLVPGTFRAEMVQDGAGLARRRRRRAPCVPRPADHRP